MVFPVVPRARGEHADAVVRAARAQALHTLRYGQLSTVALLLLRLMNASGHFNCVAANNDFDSAVRLCIDYTFTQSQ